MWVAALNVSGSPARLEPGLKRLWLVPQPEDRMVGDPIKVFIAGEHRQVMADAQLGQQRVNRSDLRALPTAMVAERGGLNVILSVRHQQRDRGKPIQDQVATLGA